MQKPDDLGMEIRTKKEFLHLTFKPKLLQIL